MSHALGVSRPRGLEALPEGHWLQRIDPRTRIVAAMAYAFLLVACRDLRVLGIGLGIGVGLMLAARLPLGPTLRRTLGVDLFIVMLLLLLPFTTPGQVWFQWGPLTATWDGLWRGVEIGLKAAGVILMLLVLVGTMDATRLGHGLHRLGVAPKLIHLLLFTVRYMGVLRREFLRLRQAMRARGFVPRSDLHTWTSYGYLFGMLLVRSLERSERVLDAMRCRGFDGRFHLLDSLRLGQADWAFGTVFAAGLILLGGLEWAGG
ncbi:MAG: cobalt ECF transporter T component CbiQ [Magnetococcales bacterium]|nr:cobalt ECF transporter T component CbiQ [Magnetococcales bacterium]